MVRWHCPADTGFEIRSLAVRGRARYHLTAILNFHEWAEKKHFLSLKCQSGVQTRDLRLSKQAALTTVPGPCPFLTCVLYTPVHSLNYYVALSAVMSSSRVNILWRQNSSLVEVPGSSPAAAEIFPWCTHRPTQWPKMFKFVVGL